MSKTSLDQVLGDYVSARVDLSAGYIEQLEVALSLFNRYLERPAKCSDLSGDTVRAWMRWLLNLPRSPRTVNGRTASLCAIWKFAHRRKLTKEGPDEIPRIKEPRMIPISYTDEQFSSMVAACDGMTHGKIMKALLLTLWDSGVRLSAVLSAKRSALNLESKTITMVEPKTKKESAYSLSDATVAALAALSPEDGSLLGWHHTATSLRDQLEKIQRKVGIPVGRSRKFHCVRKTKFTAVFIRFGLQIASSHLGHSCDLSRNYLDTRRILSGEISSHLPPPIAG